MTRTITIHEASTGTTSEVTQRIEERDGLTRSILSIDGRDVCSTVSEAGQSDLFEQLAFHQRLVKHGVRQ